MRFADGEGRAAWRLYHRSEAITLQLKSAVARTEIRHRVGEWNNSDLCMHVVVSIGTYNKANEWVRVSLAKSKQKS